MVSYTDTKKVDLEWNHDSIMPVAIYSSKDGVYRAVANFYNKKNEKSTSDEKLKNDSLYRIQRYSLEIG